MSSSLEHFNASSNVRHLPPTGNRSRIHSGKGQQLLVPIYDVHTGQIAFPEDRYRSVRRSQLGMELLFMPCDTARSSRHGSGIGSTRELRDDRRRSSSGHSIPRERERSATFGQKGSPRHASGSSSTGGMRRSSGRMSSSGDTSRGTSAMRRPSTGRGQADADDGDDDLSPVQEAQTQQQPHQIPRPHGLECRMLHTRSGVPRVVRPATSYWSHTPRADRDPATFRAVLDALERGVHSMTEWSIQYCRVSAAEFIYNNCEK